MFRKTSFSIFSKASPYISNPLRLSDLIAAIQVMGTYRFASRTMQKWEGRLGREPVSAETWKEVFQQHPEFFTIQGDELVSLVWRRSRERNYDTFIGEIVDPEMAKLLANDELEGKEKRLSRPPLNTAEISKLVDIAVDLHEREIKHRQERRWWIAIILAVVSIIGAGQFAT